MYKLLIALVFISTSVLTAQNNQNSLIHIKGTVLDSKGGPVKRAIIYVDSVKTFTKTNKRGFYKIDVPSDTGPSEPLVVVDGNYVSSTALNRFLPKDVKPIELLKDSDVAIYGARRATGVFIIELKK